ncbi:hypothetical protein FJY71_02585 [candidate division WOR-3 bacterium]|nr:hypothetical protein [candidate division WOR-3 bacterium]
MLLAVDGSAAGATYYVATTGNDTNPGTLARPWRRIGKAASTMTAGDSVLVRGGVYYENVKPGRSGTASDPITYAAYDTETVVVDGSSPVTGWVQDSASRYRAAVSFTCDPRFWTVRDPNGNHGGLVTQDGAKFQYAMEASPAAVDSPGEYYMNDSLSPPFTLYLCARDLGRGTDPNSYEIRLGRVRKGFDLDGGEDWLVAEGLSFRNYNDNAIHSIGSVGCRFSRLKLYTNFITGIYLTSGSNGCMIEHCTLWDNGHGGIELAGTRNDTIRKNLFVKRDLGDGCGGNGAHMWLGPVGQLADSNLIENNVAFGTGRFGYQGPFAAIAGSYNIFRHNSMVNSGGGAIALIDGGHNTIVNNACDMSAASAHGIAVFPNACRDSFQFIKGNCFYAQDPTDKYWWNNVRYSSLAAWESAGAQTGNIDSPPGFVNPGGEDLHLLAGSACVDHATPDSAADDDYDDVPRPQGQGYDIGAYEYVGVGAEEGPRHQASSHELGPTVIRGVLNLRLAVYGPQSRVVLVDASGRKVQDLAPGANDVRHLSPGVYFVSERSAVGAQQLTVRKVILTR